MLFLFFYKITNLLDVLITKNEKSIQYQKRIFICYTFFLMANIYVNVSISGKFVF